MSNMNCNCMSNQHSRQAARQDMCLDNASLGMAYVPWQTWGNVYDLNRGHEAGTIFPCLDKPFMGRSMWK